MDSLDLLVSVKPCRDDMALFFWAYSRKVRQENTKERKA